ncbi:MAG: GNAT family N-acetyltransferase [Saprospiraceae bacterium]
MYSKIEHIIKFLESNHIYLRPLIRSDLDHRFIAYFHTTTRSLTQLKLPKNPTQLNNWFETITNDPTRMDFIISQQRDIELVGTISLTNIDLYNRSANLSIIIPRKHYHNKGIGSEAIFLLLLYVFETLNLNRVHIQIPTYNSLAIAVANKIGFKQEGELRQAYFDKNEYHNVLQFGILKTDFEEKKMTGDYLKFKDF